jgi:hypothetical protein
MVTLRAALGPPWTTPLQLQQPVIIFVAFRDPGLDGVILQIIGFFCLLRPKKYLQSFRIFWP